MWDRTAKCCLMTGRQIPGRDRMPCDVEAGDAGVPSSWGHRRCQHADRRRLSRAIRPEQSEHFTGCDVEVDATHRLDATRPGLAQGADGHHGVVLVHCAHAVDDGTERRNVTTFPRVTFRVPAASRGVEGSC